MKKLVIGLMMVFLLVGCSSAPKEEEKKDDKSTETATKPKEENTKPKELDGYQPESIGAVLTNISYDCGDDVIATFKDGALTIGKKGSEDVDTATTEPVGQYTYFARVNKEGANKYLPVAGGKVYDFHFVATDTELSLNVNQKLTVKQLDAFTAKDACKAIR
ncbi:MAG: hypothetical protein RR565_01775 [Erysipelothrix sp.]